MYAIALTPRLFGDGLPDKPGQVPAELPAGLLAAPGQQKVQVAVSDGSFNHLPPELFKCRLSLYWPMHRATGFTGPAWIATGPAGRLSSASLLSKLTLAVKPSYPV